MGQVTCMVCGKTFRFHDPKLYNPKIDGLVHMHCGKDIEVK